MESLLMCCRNFKIREDLNTIRCAEKSTWRFDRRIGGQSEEELLIQGFRERESDRERE